MSRNILKELFDRKAEQLLDAKRRVPFQIMRANAEARGSEVERSLSGACRQAGRLNVIAEIKYASPSQGTIRAMESPEAIASQYERAGAAAVSVLTEEDHFHGSLIELTKVRETIRLPVLRKDFIFDPYQIYESKSAGADAILLIAAMLDEHNLRDLIQLGSSVGLEVLVEIHHQAEMDVAARVGARLIGVNNRNLVSFQVDLNVSRHLASVAPQGVTLVSESGLRRHAELLELQALGYHAFLIGEHLMRSEDPGSALRQLIDDGAN